MWAMIGTCIAMAIWTSGLLYMTSKTEKRRLAEIASQEAAYEKSSVIAGESNEIEKT
jgi:MFS transporter, ACS family, pantothenate transporter